MKYTAKFRTTAPPQPVLFSLYDEEPGGRRLASLAEPAGPQERIQRRTVEQFAELVPMVQILDAPVPQTVDQLVEVLRPVDTMVPEQLIDVPKITSQDAIPQRAVLRVPQMAEQLVDEPLPFFDNFELVQVSEEEEEEDEHPQVVPGSRVSDAHGRSWCRVVGPAGVYWWMIGTSTAQSPGQGRIEILAVVGDLVVDVPVTMQRQFPASSRSSCLRSRFSTEWWTFQFATVTVAENCGGSAVAVPGLLMLCSTVDTYALCSRRLLSERRSVHSRCFDRRAVFSSKTWSLFL